LRFLNHEEHERTASGNGKSAKFFVMNWVLFADLPLTVSGFAVFVVKTTYG